MHMSCGSVIYMMQGSQINSVYCHIYVNNTSSIVIKAFVHTFIYVMFFVHELLWHVFFIWQP